MKPINAVVYGVGAMNVIATRMMIEKGVNIVGALARSPEKVGRDLGEVAGLDRDLGVRIDSDPHEVLSTRTADIAVIAVSSYMEDVFPHLRVCAEYGVNAVTISEESLYPWNTSPMATAELDRLAKRTGATLTGTGHQDAYWVNLVSLMMGTAHRIDTVTGQASWNVDDYGPEVAQDQRVGDTVEQFEKWLDGADRPPTFGRNVLDALLADSGLTARSIRSTTRPELASEPVRSNSLDVVVPTGAVIGFTDVDTVETVQGPVLSFEMTGRLYLPGEADINEWSIKGEPDLHLSNPRVPTQITTCTQLVNRIPDVINAEPGFVTMEKLPKLTYRAFPLAAYVH
jgi:2,4-diaminopentanoate dehydrogenase